MTGEFIMQGHLGGYFAGGDPDTLYPEMWQWLIKELEITSILDVGCGDGTAMRMFYDYGIHDVEGVDGVPQDTPGRIFAHDYELGPWLPGRHYDLIWSCEFVEHVKEEFVPNFLRTFKHANYVAMTHALPGQTGHHHVNCQPPEYWQEQMFEIGYRPMLEVTAAARLLSHSYFAKTGVIYAFGP